MDGLLGTIAAKQGGVVMSAQAQAAGYSVDEIAYLRRRRLWVPIRRGAYVERSVFDAMEPEQLHRAKVHAVVHSLDRPAVVSHVSAAVMRDLPTYELDLSRVHVSRADLHSPRIEGGVHHHAGELRTEDVEVVDGVAVTAAPRTVIDIARDGDFESAVIVADAALGRDPAAQAAALRRLDDMRDWPGSRNASRVVAFADGRSQSVGESRSRVTFHVVGLPVPELQSVILTSDGQFVAQTDFHFVEQRTIGEFDGKAKYGQLLRPGEDPGDVVWREKQREDRLRSMGLEVVRIIWADLYRPAEIRARFLAAFARAARRGYAA